MSYIQASVLNSNDLCLQAKVEVQAGGHVYVNGKYLSHSAVEQRLRRLCAIKKSGVCEAGEDCRKMFQKGGDDRATLMELFKQSGLKKDRNAHFFGFI